MFPTKPAAQQQAVSSTLNERYNYSGQLVMNHQPSLRTVYLGNIRDDINVSEIMDHVKTGSIQAIRPLPEKSGMFITFVDTYSASQFYHEAQRNRFAVRGNEFRIGWGKPSVMNATIHVAIQNGASRNVYLGMIDDSTTEQELRHDLSRFGHVEHVKIIPEKRIAFVHFLCISNAIKCVHTLSSEPKWQSKRVNYGKDRCARMNPYQHGYPQHLIGSATAQPMSYPPPPPSSTFDMFTGVPVLYNTNTNASTNSNANTCPNEYHHHHHHHHHHVHNGGVANRTVYLGNIHPDTTAEDICNVVRGGILSQIRFLQDKHIAFVTFVDPNVAAMFISQATQQCIVLKNRRIKVGWGKPSALSLDVIQAVQHGGSRNVYIGNIDESITEEKLKHDFSEYGDIELVNTLREKNCAFVNFTSIAGAIRALEGIRSKEEYKKFRINYGKDRCGNQPKIFQQKQKSSYIETDLLIEKEEAGEEGEDDDDDEEEEQQQEPTANDPTYNTTATTNTTELHTTI